MTFTFFIIDKEGAYERLIAERHWFQNFDLQKQLEKRLKIEAAHENEPRFRCA